MPWVTILWSMMMGICVAIAGFYLLVWLLQREVWTYLTFATLALSIAGIAATELWVLRSTTIEGYGTALRWFHLPIWSAVLAGAGLVHLRMRPRRVWLGWTACALRTVSLVPNFVTGANLNYLEITRIEHVQVMGEPVAMVSGVPNPWMLIGQISLLLLTLFFLDGTVSAWRRGERALAIAMGGSLTALLVVNTVQAILGFWGLAQFPLLLTPAFVGITAVMGFELSLGTVRATRAERALRAQDDARRVSEQRLGLAAEAADAGLWSLEQGTGRIWATAKARELFGLDAERELSLADFTERIHPDDRATVLEFIDRSLASDDKVRAEFRALHPDGSPRWLAAFGRSRATPGAGSRTLTGVTVDITLRKTTEDEARRQRLQLAHLSRVATLNELSASLAHELNQPLAMILSNAEAAQVLLARDPPDLPEVSAILADIVSADRRAGDVIRRLRAFLHSGEPHRQDLTVNDAIHQVLDLVRAELADKTVSVRLSLAANLPPVRADKVLLEQAMLNLVTNACDAMLENPPGQRQLTIATRADADVVLVDIGDNGRGLPTEPERVFEAFFTTRPDGLGMGLTIVRSIVTAHGGRIWAESTAGLGATFHLTLPTAGSE